MASLLGCGTEALRLALCVPAELIDFAVDERRDVANINGGNTSNEMMY